MKKRIYQKDTNMARVFKKNRNTLRRLQYESERRTQNDFDLCSVYAVGEQFPMALPTTKDFVTMEMTILPTIIISLSNITDYEYKQLDHGSSVEFRYFKDETKCYGMLLCKLGELVYELPFNPNLRREETNIYINNNMNGIALAVLDGTTKEIVIMRVIGLTDEIKNALYKIWLEMLDNNINQDEFTAWCYSTQIYNPYEIWNMASPLGKI